MFERGTGEEHMVGVRKFLDGATAELDLFEDEVGAGCGKMAAEAGDDGVKWCRIGRQFCEQVSGLVAREPLVVGKVVTGGRWHARLAGRGLRRRK